MNRRCIWGDRGPAGLRMADQGDVLKYLNSSAIAAGGGGQKSEIGGRRLEGGEKLKAQRRKRKQSADPSATYPACLALRSIARRHLRDVLK